MKTLPDCLSVVMLMMNYLSSLVLLISLIECTLAAVNDSAIYNDIRRIIVNHALHFPRRNRRCYVGHTTTGIPTQYSNRHTNCRHLHKDLSTFGWSGLEKLKKLL